MSASEEWTNTTRRVVLCTAVGAVLGIATWHLGGEAVYLLSALAHGWPLEWDPLALAELGVPGLAGAAGGVATGFLSLPFSGTVLRRGNPVAAVLRTVLAGAALGLGLGVLFFLRDMAWGTAHYPEVASSFDMVLLSGAVYLLPCVVLAAWTALVEMLWHVVKSHSRPRGSKWEEVT